jgi:hypothetical protein
MFMDSQMAVDGDWDEPVLLKENDKLGTSGCGGGLGLDPR